MGSDEDDPNEFFQILDAYISCLVKGRILTLMLRQFDGSLWLWKMMWPLFPVSRCERWSPTNFTKLAKSLEREMVHERQILQLTIVEAILISTTDQNQFQLRLRI